MTPEEQEHEENLAALIAANLSTLQTADAVNRANAGHVAFSKGNQRTLSLTVDPAERRHMEMLEAIRDLKPKPRPTRKDIITGKSLLPRREKKCEKCARIEKFLREQLKSLTLFRERDYYKFQTYINRNTKQKLAGLMGMPVSTFGRLVNGNETLTKLCNAVMDEDVFRHYLGLRSRVV